MDIKEIDRQITKTEKCLKSIETKRNEVISVLQDLRRKKEEILHKQLTSSIPETSISQNSPSADKIALFRLLFKGREDVYARRWESIRSGKSGYQPACRNEWIRGLCRKPEIKCGDCQARDLLPLTDKVIRNHLTGFDPDEKIRAGTQRDFIIGIYPLLADNTCWFLAVDFDRESWQEDVAVFKDTCNRFDVPLSMERSRSGKGAHCWIFFSEPLPAIEARRLGSFLLTETLDNRPEVGFDSYDRLFPSQDLIPEGGFGSLIALPLQGKIREKCNTVFLDDGLSPFPDQWKFLSSVLRMKETDVERIVKDAARKGKIIGVRLPVVDEREEEPWKIARSEKKTKTLIKGPLPSRVKAVISNQIYIEKQDLSPILRSRLIRLAAFQNPEFYKAQAMRLSTYGKPRIISCAEDFPKYIGMPRGSLEEIRELFESLQIKLDLSDERNAGIPIKAQFKGLLRPEQETAVKTLLKHDTGVLAAATAFGKTVVAARLIAERAVNTLVLVHRRQLLDQWITQLSEFLDLQPVEIGQIGGGKRKPSGIIDIALIQSLWRKGKTDDIVEEYGHLIVDECHHIPASSFEQVARQSRAKYVTGLSATVTRKDGHQPIVFMQCGPVRHRVTAKQGLITHPFQHLVIFRETQFSMPHSEGKEKVSIHEVYEALISNKSRNNLIFEDVMKFIAEENRSPLIITERREHLEMLALQFQPYVQNVIVFKGGMGQKQRLKLYEKLASIPDNEERLLISTGRYLGEGFDDARLDTLFLTLPISWKGTIAQYAGRLHRFHYNKKDVRIYDYIDLNVPMLERMYKKRLRGYRAIGYDVAESSSISKS